MLAQELVDIGEQRLVDIHRQELDLGVDDQHVAQPRLGVAHRHQLAALDVDLQHFRAGGLRDIVEPHGIDGLGGDHLAPVGEAVEKVEHVRIRLEQRGHARREADVERVPAAVADRVGQVGLAGPLLGVELRQGAPVRLEPDDVGIAGRQERRIGRTIFVDRIGADVNDFDPDMPVRERLE